MPTPNLSETHPSGSPARRQSTISTSKPRLKMNSNFEVRSRTNSVTSAPSRRSSSLSRDESLRRHSDLSKSSHTSDPFHKVIDKLEALSSKHESLLTRHETLISRCEVLEKQHSDLIIKHSEVLDVLNQLVTVASQSDPPIASKSSPSIRPQSSPTIRPQLCLQKVSDSPAVKPQPSPVLPKTSSWTIKQPASVSNSPARRLGSMTDRRDTKSPARNSHRKSTNNHTPATDYGLRVCIRKRPAGEEESDCVECVDNQVFLHEDKVKVDLTKYESVTKFNLDGVFSEEHTTVDVYQESVQNLIDNFFAGGTSTCFCFGQTASGKTFTLFGEGGGTQQGSILETSGDSGGIYMLAAADAFKRLEQFRATQGNGAVVLQLSMFEIYGQKVRDLLADCKELAALEDGNGVLQLVGLEAYGCVDLADFVAASNQGRSARATNATGANATSSRSHAALLLRLVNTETSEVLGKFSLIDLAGSERGADNEATDKQTQMEGRQINTSLLALKEVIRAKELGRHHAPFRQSRLTQVLEESLTGERCYTTVIGCVSPCVKDTQQTLNTLRYAESLSPSTGKKPKISTSQALEEEEAEKGAASLSSPRSPPAMMRSRQESMSLMNNEFKTDGGDDEDFLI